MKKLDIALTVKESFALALKNSASIFGCTILWAITLWIPYINIGTTIALVNLPIELAKGKIVNPTSIFSSIYRKKMGDYLIYFSLFYVGVGCASLFMVIPAIILSIAWSLAVFIMIKYDKNPIEALKISNNITYGNKCRIFGVNFIVGLALLIVSSILLGIVLLIDVSFITFLMLLILCVFAEGVNIAIQASIWGQLEERINEGSSTEE